MHSLLKSPDSPDQEYYWVPPSEHHSLLMFYNPFKIFSSMLVGFTAGSISSFFLPLDFFFNLVATGLINSWRHQTISKNGQLNICNAPYMLRSNGKSFAFLGTGQLFIFQPYLNLQICYWLTVHGPDAVHWCQRNDILGFIFRLNSYSLLITNTIWYLIFSILNAHMHMSPRYRKWCQIADPLDIAPLSDSSCILYLRAWIT